MSIFKYPAKDLFSWLTNKQNFLLLDVRNSQDFNRFQIESPFPFEMLNISYFDFMEIEDECVAKIPKDKPVRIVCAQEGSAKYVAEILENHGIEDIGYLEDGIKSWGNLLVPVLLNPDEKFQLFQFIRPGKASCSYGLKYKKELMLFDPSRNSEFYLEFSRENSCKLIKTFETHLQADYISGSRILSETTGAEFLANENDFGTSKLSYTPVQNGELIAFSGNGPEVKVFFTPGHTPGSTSVIIDNKYFISGDSIFIQSVGRPDLGGEVDAWSDILFDTLQKIKKIDSSMVVLPGHYISWEEANSNLSFAATMAQVSNFNKDILALDEKTDFLAFIKSNMRDQPSEYATIRLINGNFEQVDNDKAEELDLGKNECAASAYTAEQAS